MNHDASDPSQTSLVYADHAQNNDPPHHLPAAASETDFAAAMIEVGTAENASTASEN